MSAIRKKKSSVLLESRQNDQEIVEEPPKDEEARSFDSPMPMDAELARLYEEHKKELAGVSGPYVPRTTREEDEAMFARMGDLSKRDRKNPERNYDLMPEKPIIDEKLPEGVDDGMTLKP